MQLPNQQQMRLIVLLALFVVGTVIVSCKKKNPVAPSNETTTIEACYEPNDTLIIESRNFQMGFSTWPYAATTAARNETYDFLESNGDAYSEQFDDHIPWFGLIDGKPFPEPATADLNNRVNNLIQNHELIMSVSLFNPDRNNLITAYNGEIPGYSSLADQPLEDAYVAYITTILDKFPNTTYLIVAMEINEFYTNNPDQWESYKTLISAVKSRLYVQYPTLKISESITLHNFVQSTDLEYINTITEYVNTLDFVAISYYPFMHGALEDQQIQDAFDFLHSKITKPIAFVETGQIAEELDLPDIVLAADECTQKDYVQTLLANAQEQNYEFVIWWTHKDYDELFETLDEQTKPLARIWRDAGLVNQSDQERPGLREWKSILMR